MTTRDQLTYVVAVTAAMLSHEAAVLTAVIAAVLLWKGRATTRSASLRRLAVSATPLVIFAALYASHLLRVSRPWFVEGTEADGMFTVQNLAWAVPKMFYALGLWIVSTLNSAAFRVEAGPVDYVARHFVVSPLSIAQLVCVVALLYIAARCVSMRQVRDAWPVVVLCGGAIIVYVGLVGLGRGVTDIEGKHAFLYFAQPLALVAVYSTIDFLRVRTRTRVAGALFIAALLIVMAYDNATTTRAIAERHRPVTQYFRAIEAFVDDHRTDPNFTFAITNPPHDRDPVIRLLEGYPDSPSAVTHERRLSDVLYRRFRDDVSPAYQLDGPQLAR
jgi:hypothetical protein